MEDHIYLRHFNKQNMINLASLSKYKDLGFLIIRFTFGFRLIYGTIDNIISFEQMLHFRDFLSDHGFPLPLVSAIISVAFQFLAGLSFIAGFWIRFFSLLMIFNFTIALLMVHVGDTYINMAPAIHLLAVSAFFLTNGAGKYSLDSKLSSDKNLSENKLSQAKKIWFFTTSEVFDLNYKETKTITS